jgi:hypothetical protein
LIDSLIGQWKLFGTSRNACSKSNFFPIGSEINFKEDGTCRVGSEGNQFLRFKYDFNASRGILRLSFKYGPPNLLVVSEVINGKQKQGLILRICDHQGNYDDIIQILSPSNRPPGPHAKVH